MSDAQHTEHEENHEGPIKTPKQLIWAVVGSFVIPVLLIIMLTNFVAWNPKPAAGSDSLAAEAVASRIQPVGAIQIKAAGDVSALKSGEQVYAAQCSACHASGAAGAPKLGDAAAWGPRVGAGYEALLASAIKGKGNMGAQGGGEHSDLEIGRAVVYMANQGGAKFAEPKAPAGAASGATADAAAAAPAPAAEPASAAAAAPAAAAAADGPRVETAAGVVKLYFASGKAELPADAKAALGKLADEIKAGGKAVAISGYHDAKGNAKANADLAKRRAFGARDLLVAAGVAQDKITLKKPESTTGDGDPAQARRVEVTIQ
jgi:cytochrome c5